MAEAPAGFTIVSRDPKGFVEGLMLSVTGTQIGFYGSVMVDHPDEVCFDVASNGGTQFAINFNSKGQFKVRRDKQSLGGFAFHTQVQKLRDLIPAGKYQGTLQDNWWVFALDQTEG